jgi:hypothetical protein
MTNNGTTPARALPTGALIGVRMAQAAGWRVGAFVLAPLACPALAFGAYALNDFIFHLSCTSVYRDMPCKPHYDALTVGMAGIAFGLLFLLAAWGLWRRGGAVRDIELLAERVEGSAD